MLCCADSCDLVTMDVDLLRVQASNGSRTVMKQPVSKAVGKAASKAKSATKQATSKATQSAKKVAKKAPSVPKGARKTVRHVSYLNSCR